ncbi:hypothetical protein LCGC14_1504210 [marine sediment metagenome]|uniref:GIY-YIG domain-containing protein n=1 Tax=marine sediment metagenome TaxID=412755 RepID=A0A0F9JNZ6_9ZZZZ
MIEKRTCDYCGWKIPADFIHRVSENSDSIFCENCGTEIQSEKPVCDIINSEEKSNQDLSSKKKKRAMFSKFYERIRREKNPVARVLLDSDFIKTFKDNFLLVMSRVIYYHLRTLGFESAIEVKAGELTKDVAEKLYKEISPVFSKRFKRVYLENLHKMNRRDFEKWLIKLHTKLKLNKNFHNDFVLYLRWLINEVYIIASEFWDSTNLPKFERIIRDDLKGFSYCAEEGKSSTNRLLKNHLGIEIPYRDLGVYVNNMDPKQFKKAYKGLFFQYFKFVRDQHNLYLGVKSSLTLLKLFKKMSVYGVIYKISLVKDEEGNAVNDGPFIIYSNENQVKEGLTRIGRSINFWSRLKSYMTKAGNLNWQYHFENSLAKNGPYAFKAKILAICRTEKEFKATEYFWQLFYNKKAIEEGFDLNINEKFNLQLGSRFDEMKRYNIPKYKMIFDLLDGYELNDLILKYKSRKAVVNRLSNYFNGIRDTFIIKAHLVGPYIDLCLKRGLTREETLSQLIHDGFKMFDINKRKELQNFNFKQNRANIDNLFNKILDYLYEPPKRLAKSSGSSRYEQIREDLFIKPFVDYLRRINIGDTIENTYYRDRFGRFTFKISNGQIINPNEFSIVEHLVMHNVKNTEIAIQLGLCRRDDNRDTKVKAADRIRVYLKSRWKSVLESLGIRYSIKNLGIFLKSNFLKSDIYKDFLATF